MYQIQVERHDSMKLYNEIIEEASKFWEEHAWSTALKIPFAPKREVFKALCERNLILSVVLRLNGKLIGAYVGALDSFVYNPDLTCASEIFWFIIKEHRKTPAAVRLLQAVQQALKEINVDLMTCSIAHINTESQEITNKKIDGLGRLGYNKTDTVFYKRV